jgi:hypothetical protein
MLWSDPWPRAVTFLEGTSSTASFATSAAFSVAGVYVLRLTADDSQGVSADDIAITVKPKINQAPLVNAGPQKLRRRLIE